MHVSVRRYWAKHFYPGIPFISSLSSKMTMALQYDRVMNDASEANCKGGLNTDVIFISLTPFGSFRSLISRGAPYIHYVYV